MKTVRISAIIIAIIATLITITALIGVSKNNTGGTHAEEQLLFLLTGSIAITFTGVYVMAKKRNHAGVFTCLAIYLVIISLLTGPDGLDPVIRKNHAILATVLALITGVSCFKSREEREDG